MGFSVCESHLLGLAGLRAGIVKTSGKESGFRI